MWVKLGHTPDAVEKIKCDTFKLIFLGNASHLLTREHSRQS